MRIWSETKKTHFNSSNLYKKYTKNRNLTNMGKMAVAIHGGAGTILKGNMTPDKEAAYRGLLDKAVTAAHKILDGGGSAVDAVELAVVIMEGL